MRFAVLQRIGRKANRIFEGSRCSGTGWCAHQILWRSIGTETTNKTSLYDFHLRHKGKIVNFGGFLLPVQYADQSIIASHRHTRTNASIFDVSHMLQTYMTGKNVIECIESICPADVRGLPDGTGTLTVFTNDNGGILDDLIVNRINDHQLYIVSNAAMRNQDMSIMEAAVSKCKGNGKDVSIEFLTPEQQSLIAVQGPKAVQILEKLLPKNENLSNLYFMQGKLSSIADVPNCRITRCGYTGEDGVEISIDSNRVEHVTEALLQADPNMKLAGLGARDSLRLEAGLCLYGSDINAEITPIEASLTWLIAKRRRSELNFPGADVIVKQLSQTTDTSTKRRIGLSMLGVNNPPPARAGAKIFQNNTLVGSITSGCPSPSLNRNISMGYIQKDLRKPGTPVQIQIRDKFFDAEIQRIPFVPSNYYMQPKGS